MSIHRRLKPLKKSLKKRLNKAAKMRRKERIARRRKR